MSCPQRCALSFSIRWYGKRYLTRKMALQSKAHVTTKYAPSNSQNSLQRTMWCRYSFMQTTCLSHAALQTDSNASFNASTKSHRVAARHQPEEDKVDDDHEGTGDLPAVTLRGEKVKTVDEFKYLGRIFGIHMTLTKRYQTASR